MAFVNATGKTETASATTSVLDALACTTGNSIYVFTSNYVSGSPKTVASVTDTAGNTYARVGNRYGPSGDCWMECWAADNITGNANNVITITFSAAATYRHCHAVQRSAMANPSYDAESSGQISDATGTNVFTTLGVTTTAPNDVVLGWFVGWGSAFGPSAESPSALRSTAGSTAVSELTAGSAGSYDTEIHTDTTTTAACKAWAFKVATGAVRIGAPVAVYGAASTGVTVPADATLAVLSYGFWDTTGTDVTSATINGVGFTKYLSWPGNSGVNGSVGVWYLPNPATGSQTLVISTNGSMTDLPMFVTFYKGANLSTPIRDADTATGYATTITSTAFDVVAGDLCEAAVFGYTSTPPDVAIAGQTQIGSNFGGGSYEYCRMAEKTASSTGTDTMQATHNSYVTIIAFAVKTAGATYKAAENTNITLPAGSTFRLRVQLDATGSVGAKLLQLDQKRSTRSMWERTN